MLFNLVVVLYADVVVIEEGGTAKKRKRDTLRHDDAHDMLHEATFKCACISIG